MCIMYLLAYMSSDSLQIRTYASDEEYSPLTPPASPVAASEQPPTLPTSSPVAASEQPLVAPVAAPEQPPALPAPVTGEESEPKEDFPISLSQPLPSLSPEPMRRRLDPIDDTIVYEEIMHVPSSSSSREWEWLPDMIRSWIREERVPPPFSYLADPSSSTLPSLVFPLEQAFAAFVTKTDREFRHMREAAGEINRISSTQERMKERNDEIIESLQETDDNHGHLADEVSELRAHIIELTTRVNVAEAQVLQLTNRLNDVEAIAAAAEATANEAMVIVEAAVEDAEQQLENQPEEPAEEQGSQSTVSSAHSAN